MAAVAHAVDEVLDLAWGPRASLAEVTAHVEASFGRRPTDVVDLDTAWRFDFEDSRRWVVRSFPRPVRVESIVADADALAHLAAVGLAAERPAHPSACTQLPSGHAVLVTEFVDGDRPSPTSSTLLRLADLAGLLAAAPTGSRLRTPAGAYPNYTPPGSIASELANARRCLDAVAGEVPEPLHDTLDALRRALERADALDGLPTSIVHPDLRLANVVDTGDQLVAFDWHGVGIGPRIVPLGVLLAYETATPDAPLAAAVDAAIVPFVAHIGLTDAEIERLPAATEHRPLISEAIGLALGVRLGTDPFSPGAWTGNRDRFDEIHELVRAALEGGRR